MRPLWSVTFTNPHLTASFPLSPTLPPLLSICSLVPHSPPASRTLHLLPTLQRLRSTILTDFKSFLAVIVAPHYPPVPLLPYFCFLLSFSLSFSFSLAFIPCIALDYSFLSLFSLSFLRPPLPPSFFSLFLSLSHSSLSPADSAGISIHRDHMTISPIGSPPPPMSSYRLAPFPAKSRPARAALAALRRPSGWAVRNAAPLLFHAGLDLP